MMPYPWRSSLARAIRICRVAGESGRESLGLMIGIRYIGFRVICQPNILVPPEPLSHNPVPPHHGAGNEHGGGSKSRQSPDEFRRLVAETRSAAGNAYSVNPAKVQVG